MKTLVVSLMGILGASGCNFQRSDSGTNFASDNLGKFDTDFFDVKLIPKAIKGQRDQEGRSLDLSSHLYEMRFFRIKYANQVPLDQPLEGDVVSFEDEGGSMITVDKFSDSVIEITTALPNRKEIEDGHYAAVICPISTTRTKNCLVDPEPLTAYKNAVQGGQCGKITSDGSSLSDSCKRGLFTGKNTFVAIAYPLTASKNKFISGDKELVFVKSLSLSLSAESPAELDPGCVSDIDKMQTNGISNNAFTNVCSKPQPSPLPAPQSPPVASNTDINNKGQQPLSPTPTPPLRQPPPPRAPQTPPAGSAGFQGPYMPPRPPPSVAGPIPPMMGYPGSGGFNQGSFPGMMPPNFAGMPGNEAWPMGAMGSDCFAAGAQILGVLSNDFQGAQSRLQNLEIQNIKKGDWVYNPLTHSLTKVSELTSSSVAKGRMVYDIGDSGIQVTGVHPVIRPDGYDMIAALFKATEVSSREDRLLYSKEGDLRYRQVNVSRQRLSSDLNVYNIITDDSNAVKLQGPAADLAVLSSKFQCDGSDQQGCQHFLAVNDGSGGFLVTGDFVKQQELHRSFAYFSSVTYKTSKDQ